MALDKLQFDRTAAAPGTFSTDMLNRIEEWTAFLADKLRGYGYAVNITPRNAERPQTSRLPDGYTELEYIQSNGTQYIDTGFKPNQDTRVICTVENFPNTKYSQAIFGARTSTTSSDSFVFLSAEDIKSYRSDYGSNRGTVGSGFNVPDRLVVDKNKNITTLNDQKETVNPTATFTSKNLFLLACNTNGGASLKSTGVRLLSCKIYNNGTLIRDLVPCKNASGTVGLYDLVQSKFYTNAGTGAFIAGAEAPPPVLLDPALWYQSDIPTRGEIDRIRRNVDALQTGFARLPDWREILYNNTVDFGQANALEWDLQRIYDWMNAMTAAFLTRQANTIFMQAGGILNA